MAANSKIEWTTDTWNLVGGCSLKSEGCRNCYAMAMAHRLEAMGQAKYAGTTKKVGNRVVWTERINLDESALLLPFAWRKPRKIFVNSMSDLFHEEVPFEFIDRAFAVMALCPQHTFQVLTKRPGRMAEWATGARERVMAAVGTMDDFPPQFEDRGWPLPNVWMGTSVENQAAADERVPELLRVPAAVRFLSCEPLLGPVEFSDVTRRADCVSQLGKRALDGINWVIVGGESGPNARPMHPAWARSIRDQCQEAWVPFFFKQWGEWRYCPERAHFKEAFREPWERVDSKLEGIRPALMFRVRKKAAGRLLDGRSGMSFR